MKQEHYRAFEEITGNPRDSAVFFRITALRDIYKQTKQKTRYYIWSREMSIKNFKSLSFFVWSEARAQTDRQTYRYSSNCRTTTCPNHVDSILNSLPLISTT